ncbi:DUF2182 domain-containing protein [Streptomyces bambusae]|uniref:DUF2182 domain-containing protein n=1 Tax=Streptomyces bambusae TaxID=1550616 RepID=UPI001CFE850D|nr:DUF2182 domain-containing protein [Streptomyces bambusae]MCB5165102.1 DUF2182 domain-containing protein [Streptomyces bambusae]
MSAPAPVREAAAPRPAAASPGVWSRRVTVTTTVWVLAASAFAWWWMLAGGHGTDPAAGTGAGAGAGAGHHGGHHGPAAAAAGVSGAEAAMFLAMWAGMVVAMMFPVAVPLIAAHRFVTRTRGPRGAAETGFLVAGYLLAWVAAGLVPLLLMAGKRAVLPESFDGPWRVALTGLVLAVAGLFQFSGLKTRCLTVCRSPLQFVLTHDFRAGLPGALRAGALNGVYCLGCCWALMLVQVAVGLDNIAWMGTLTLLFLAERMLRRGQALARVTGTVMTVLGVVLVMEPLVHTPLAGLL